MWMMLAGNVIEAPELELLCCKNLFLVHVRKCEVLGSASSEIVVNVSQLNWGLGRKSGLGSLHFTPSCCQWSEQLTF